MRLSLFTKILLWFFLNVLVSGLVLIIFFSQQVPSVTRIFGESSNGIRAVAQLITSEIREKTKAERDAILQRYAEAYQVELLLYTSAGEKLAGKEVDLPKEVMQQITAPPPMRPPPPGGNLPPRPPPFPVHLLQTKNPVRYWAVVRIPVYEKGQVEETKSSLIASSELRSGNGLFFDLRPWVMVAIAMFVLSIILWIPFVRSLTTSIKQLTTVTEQIAEENFAVRVNENRNDELGRLGKAINHLATRLSGFVHGQKRFLGDISHELNSPLARMQFALSILENRVEPNARSYVADVQEEVTLMTRLVSELLAYSKAGIKQSEIKLEPVNVHSLVRQVVAREAATHPDIRNEVAAEIQVLAQPELLGRALGNVIRNAVRYAGPTMPIIIQSQSQGTHVKICIADGGAGVPEEALSQLFDPFFRLESDRARETGGSGLGLAIVKTCVEACQGTVSARNRLPNGLEIVITLAAA